MATNIKLIHLVACKYKYQEISFDLPKRIFDIIFNFFETFSECVLVYSHEHLFFSFCLLNNLSLMCMFIPINIFKLALFHTGFTRFISFDYLSPS